MRLPIDYTRHDRRNTGAFMAKSHKSARGQSIPDIIREKHDAVLKLVDDFCQAHLNQEYAVLCGEVVGILARKRPSPMVNGTPAAWACGIVRAVGYVNGLDDKSQQPHIKFAEIDKYFGVSTGTGQGRSKAIRELLKISPLDPDWTLPSRIHSNPMAWMIQVNGFIVDARWMPREVQEKALERGLIPYLPDANANPSGDEP